MKWLALLAWTFAFPVLHAADWIAINSANFELLTNAPADQARKTLAKFEQARDFFVREVPSLSGSTTPATIIGFNSFDDYRPYSPKADALAYHFRHELGDFIVISDLQLQRTRVAIHEYVHLLVSHSGLSIPLWLDEGMAEVYSTLEERDGKLVLGTMKEDRLQSLGSENWMRLPTLLRATAESREYNEPDVEPIFYAESCLLAHMLILADGYADKFPRFLERVAATSSAQAFAEVYGKNTADIEKEMTTYFRQRIQGGAVYRSALPKVDIGQARAASEPEVGVALAGLTAHLGRPMEARNRLKELATKYPANGDVAGALAELEEQNGETDAALAHYRSALALHPALWSTYWNYARLLDDQGGELAPRLQALEEVLQRKKDWTQALLRLAEDLCSSGRFADALARLQAAGNVAPEFTAARFAEMANASLGLKQVADAGRYAEEARKAAQTPEQKAAVDRLLVYLQQHTTTDKPTETRPSSDPDPDRPILRHATPPPPPKKGGGR